MVKQKGFLTGADRSFLLGEKDYNSKQGRYQRRRSIRERTRAAFDDFTLLLSELDEDERKKIFDPISDGVYHPRAVPGRELDPPEEYVEARRLKDGLTSVFQFVYLGVWSTGVPYEELVKSAVFHAEKELGRLVDVSLNIEPKDPMGAVEAAIEKLEQGQVKEMSYTENRLLMKFVTDPDSFSPGSVVQETIDRLNALGPFSIETAESG